MRRSYFFMAGFLAVLMLAIVPAGAADPDTIYVRYVEGVVHLSEAGSPQGMEAVANTPLIEGDTIATGQNGKAELFLKDGSIVRAGSNSAIKIIAVDDKGIQFKLDRGTAYIVSQGSTGVPIFFDAPLAAVDITSPSTVRIDAYSNGINEISVLKGGIFASQRSGRMLVSVGERLVLKADASMPLMAALRAADEWLRWNTYRDNMTTVADTGSSDSYTYLPEELRTYSSDLDINGQWIYTPEYNYVWVPTVITVSEWSPYRYGRWAWIRGSYVWIGYEPWGWAPYHYGRWVHHRQAGWCWVPPRHRDVRWEPAHVAWINSSRHVGWVPLAPGEHYDRRSAPVIHQTNIYNTTYKNVTIERSAANARTSYKNASVVNSMVTVESSRMVREKTINVAALNKGPATLKKVSIPARISQPPVSTRQLPGSSLSSRIENARGTPRKDDRTSGGAPAAEPMKTATVPRAKKTAINDGPAAKTDSRLSPPQPAGFRQEANTRSTSSYRSPVNSAGPSQADQKSVRPMPPREPQNIQQTGKESSVRAVNATSPTGQISKPSVRVIPVGSPEKAAASTVHAAVNQTSRPARPERQPSPVVSAAPQPASAPSVSSRPPQVRSEPARNPAPQAVNQSSHAPSPKAAVSQAPVSAHAAAPHAAPAAKSVSVPAQPSKDENNSVPEKGNNKPHTRER